MEEQFSKVRDEMENSIERFQKSFSDNQFWEKLRRFARNAGAEVVTCFPFPVDKSILSDLDRSIRIKDLRAELPGRSKQLRRRTGIVIIMKRGDHRNPEAPADTAEAPAETDGMDALIEAAKAEGESRNSWVQEELLQIANKHHLSDEQAEQLVADVAKACEEGLKTTLTEGE